MRCCSGRGGGRGAAETSSPSSCLSWLCYGTALASQVCSGGDAQVQRECAATEFGTVAPEHTHPTALLGVGRQQPFLNCQGTFKGDACTVYSYCVFVI